MDWLVLVTLAISLLSGTLSGISGGGGGFVMTPYFLFIGLPPASAIATGKLGGIGIAVGAVTAFRGKGLVHKGLIYKLVAITVVSALISSFLIPKIDPHIFQKVIGAFLILCIPTLFISKAAFQPGARSGRWIGVGFVLYAAFSLLQTMVASGIGTMLVLILMFAFGLGALEANATKRVAQSVQAGIMLVLLALQGLVYWWHGLAGLLGTTIGSHLGAHIAMKHGVKFVKVALAVVMAVSGVALLL